MILLKTCCFGHQNESIEHVCIWFLVRLQFKKEKATDLNESFYSEILYENKDNMLNDCDVIVHFLIFRYLCSLYFSVYEVIVHEHTHLMYSNTLVYESFEILNIWE